MHEHPSHTSDLGIVWRSVMSADIIEARRVDADGCALYVGYVAHTLGDGDDEWRGYVGIRHAPVGMGRLSTVQAAVERAACAAWIAGVASGQYEHRGRRGALYGSDQ